MLETSLERLSSGLRINRGADDPSGLIKSENLRADIANVGQAIRNTQRASQVIATTEGALNEVSNLLIDIQDLIVEAANTGAISSDEVRANQLQIDSAVASITRVANTTTFAGLKLLDGSLDYVTSGVDDSVVSNLELTSVQFGSRDTIPVSVGMLETASQAELFLTGSTITSGVTIEIAGPVGVTTLTFGSGATTSAIALAVDSVSDSTGINAVMVNSANAASGIVFRSIDYGSKTFVSVDPLTPNSTFAVQDVNGVIGKRDEGHDALATVNGIAALADGLQLIVNTETLKIDLTLDTSFQVGSSTTFAVIGGGAAFQIGPEVTPNQQVNIGVRSMAASRLGNDQLGFLSELATGGKYSLLSAEFDRASRIAQEAIQDVAFMRGRLGAFERNTLDTTKRQLEITLENLIASESEIRDADFAVETAALSRGQILVNAGTSVLARANASPQNVLALLQ
jgi:flagellin